MVKPSAALRSSMKIIDVSPVLLSVGGPETDTEVAGLWPRSTCLVRIESDTGLTGLGEAYAGSFAPEVAASLVQNFRPLLLGEDPFAIGLLWDKLASRMRNWGGSGIAMSVLGGVDCALWDLAGKAMGVPTYQLLGGLARKELPIYASGGSVLWPPDACIKRVERYVQQGFRSVKLNVGHAGRPEADTLGQFIREEREKWKALRAAIGWDVALSIDACQGFSCRSWSSTTAVQVATALEEFQLAWLEEPCAFTDLEGWAAVRRSVQTPIAGGETTATADELRRLIEARAIDIAQPDATHAAGITECQRMISLAGAHHIPVALHCYGTAVAMAANIHLAFASPQVVLQEYPVLEHPLRSQLWVEPPQRRGGVLLPPSAPGLGVCLPEAAVQGYPFIPGSGAQMAFSTGPRNQT